MFKKIIAFAISFCLIFEQSGFAQVAGQMQIPGYLTNLLPADNFSPVQLRSVIYNPTQESFRLMLDKGDEAVRSKQLDSTAGVLWNYFLIGLRLPNTMFWVNLRPDAPTDVIDPNLEKTDMGRILLAADLQLKKDMARFTSPDTADGKQYWNKLYAKAEQLYGQADMEIPTLTRPWIVPGEVIIKEASNGAYIYKASLSVMLEQDYIKDSPFYNFSDPKQKELNAYSSDLIRSTVLPRLIREINSSKRYAELRQVYYSVVLAQWFKQRLEGQAGGLAAKIDSKDLTGLTSATAWSKDSYYNAYKKSFSQGEYSKEETVNTGSGLVVRNYFSGGIKMLPGSTTGVAAADILAADLPAYVTTPNNEVVPAPAEQKTQPVDSKKKAIETFGDLKAMMLTPDFATTLGLDVNTEVPVLKEAVNFMPQIRSGDEGDVFGELTRILKIWQDMVTTFPGRHPDYPNKIERLQFAIEQIKKYDLAIKDGGELKDETAPITQRASFIRNFGLVFSGWGKAAEIIQANKFYDDATSFGEWVSWGGQVQGLASELKKKIGVERAKDFYGFVTQFAKISGVLALGAVAAMVGIPVIAASAGAFSVGTAISFFAASIAVTAFLGIQYFASSTLKRAMSLTNIGTSPASQTATEIAELARYKERLIARYEAHDIKASALEAPGVTISHTPNVEKIGARLYERNPDTVISFFNEPVLKIETEYAGGYGVYGFPVVVFGDYRFENGRMFIKARGTEIEIKNTEIINGLIKDGGELKTQNAPPIIDRIGEAIDNFYTHDFYSHNTLINVVGVLTQEFLRIYVPLWIVGLPSAALIAGANYVMGNSQWLELFTTPWGLILGVPVLSMVSVLLGGALMIVGGLSHNAWDWVSPKADLALWKIERFVAIQKFRAKFDKMNDTQKVIELTKILGYYYFADRAYTDEQPQETFNNDVAEFAAKNQLSISHETRDKAFENFESRWLYWLSSETRFVPKDSWEDKYKPVVKPELKNPAYAVDLEQMMDAIINGQDVIITDSANNEYTVRFGETYADGQGNIKRSAEYIRNDLILGFNANRLYGTITGINGKAVNKPFTAIQLGTGGFITSSYASRNDMKLEDGQLYKMTNREKYDPAYVLGLGTESLMMRTKDGGVDMRRIGYLVMRRVTPEGIAQRINDVMNKYAGTNKRLYAEAAKDKNTALKNEDLFSGVHRATLNGLVGATMALREQRLKQGHPRVSLKELLEDIAGGANYRPSYTPFRGQRDWPDYMTDEEARLRQSFSSLAERTAKLFTKEKNIAYPITPERHYFDGWGYYMEGRISSMASEISRQLYHKGYDDLYARSKKSTPTDKQIISYLDKRYPDAGSMTEYFDSHADELVKFMSGRYDADQDLDGESLWDSADVTNKEAAIFPNLAAVNAVIAGYRLIDGDSVEQILDKIIEHSESNPRLTDAEMDLLVRMTDMAWQVSQSFVKKSAPAKASAALSKDERDRYVAQIQEAARIIRGVLQEQVPVADDMDVVRTYYHNEFNKLPADRRQFYGSLYTDSYRNYTPDYKALNADYTGDFLGNFDFKRIRDYSITIPAITADNRDKSINEILQDAPHAFVEGEKLTEKDKTEIRTFISVLIKFINNWTNRELRFILAEQINTPQDLQEQLDNDLNEIFQNRFNFDYHGNSAAFSDRTSEYYVPDQKSIFDAFIYSGFAMSTYYDSLWPGDNQRINIDRFYIFLADNHVVIKKMVTDGVVKAAREAAAREERALTKARESAAKVVSALPTVSVTVDSARKLQAWAIAKEARSKAEAIAGAKIIELFEAKNLKAINDQISYTVVSEGYTQNPDGTKSSVYEIVYLLSVKETQDGGKGTEARAQAEKVVSALRTISVVVDSETKAQEGWVRRPDAVMIEEALGQAQNIIDAKIAELFGKDALYAAKDQISLKITKSEYLQNAKMIANPNYGYTFVLSVNPVDSGLPQEVEAMKRRIFSRLPVIRPSWDYPSAPPLRSTETNYANAQTLKEKIALLVRAAEGLLEDAQISKVQGEIRISTTELEELRLLEARIVKYSGETTEDQKVPAGKNQDKPAAADEVINEIKEISITIGKSGEVLYAVEEARKELLTKLLAKKYSLYQADKIMSLIGFRFMSEKSGYIATTYMFKLEPATNSGLFKNDPGTARRFVDMSEKDLIKAAQAIVKAYPTMKERVENIQATQETYTGAFDSSTGRPQSNTLYYTQSDDWIKSQAYSQAAGRLRKIVEEEYGRQNANKIFYRLNLKVEIEKPASQYSSRNCVVTLTTVDGGALTRKATNNQYTTHLELYDGQTRVFAGVYDSREKRASSFDDCIIGFDNNGNMLIYGPDGKAYPVTDEVYSFLYWDAAYAIKDFLTSPASRKNGVSTKQVSSDETASFRAGKKIFAIKEFPMRGKQAISPSGLKVTFKNNRVVDIVDGGREEFINAQIDLLKNSEVEWSDKIVYSEENAQKARDSIETIRQTMAEFLDVVSRTESLRLREKDILAALEIVISEQGKKLRADGKRYPVHPLQAALKFVTIYGITDPDFIISAILHDTIEDVDKYNKNPGLIGGEFGERIQKNVQSVTNKELPSDQKAILEEFLRKEVFNNDNSEQTNKALTAIMAIIEYQLGVIREVKENSDTLYLKSVDFSDNALTQKNLASNAKLQARLSSKYRDLLLVFAGMFDELAKAESMKKDGERNDTLITGLQNNAQVYRQAYNELLGYSGAYEYAVQHNKAMEKIINTYGGLEGLEAALAAPVKGGIDFRAVPMFTQPGMGMGVPAIDMKQLQLLAEKSTIKDLDKEWTSIQKQMQGKQMPYAKMKEYVAVCCQKKADNKHMNDVAACVSKILKLEEKCAVATSPEMKELLVMIEAARVG